MRGIWLLVGACGIALVVAGCGTTLGPKDEGRELLPGAPILADQPSETTPPLEPLAPEEVDPTSEPLPPALPPEDPIELLDEVNPINPFTEAVRLLLRGRSVRIAVTSTSKIPDTGQEFRVRSDGFYDIRSFTGAIDVDATNLVRRLGSEPEDGAAFVAGRLVFTENTVYLSYEDLPEVDSDQAPWASAAYRQLVGTPAWPDQGTVSALALTTPAHVVALLRAARKTFTEIGAQPIRGAPSTHYRALVDLAKVPAAAPEVTRGALRTQTRALAAALGTSELPIDVWLDAKGRMRRVEIDLGAAAAAAPPPEPAAEPVAPAEPVEEAPSVDEPIVEDPAETDPPPASEDAPPESLADETLPALDQEVATLGAKVVASPPEPPNAVLVIDFVTSGGRVRAQVPSEEETGPYADVVRLARASEPSDAG